MDSQLITRFQAHLEEQGRSPGTAKGYVNNLGLFAEWLERVTGRPFSPESVAPLDIRSYPGHLQAVKGLAPSTINRRLQAIRSFFRCARTAGFTQEDPAAEVQPVSTTRRQFAPKSLNRQQIHRLLRAAQWSRHPERDYAIPQTMLRLKPCLWHGFNLRKPSKPGASARRFDPATLTGQVLLPKRQHAEHRNKAAVFCQAQGPALLGLGPWARQDSRGKPR